MEYFTCWTWTWIISTCCPTVQRSPQYKLAPPGIVYTLNPDVSEKNTYRGNSKDQSHYITVPHWSLPLFLSALEAHGWQNYRPPLFYVTQLELRAWSMRQNSSRNLLEVKHRVHILLKEGNPNSLVFQNIDPPSPSPPGESVLPPQQRRGVHTRRAEREWGVNILEDERDRIALLQ